MLSVLSVRRPFGLPHAYGGRAAHADLKVDQLPQEAGVGIDATVLRHVVYRLCMRASEARRVRSCGKGRTSQTHAAVLHEIRQHLMKGEFRADNARVTW